MADHATIARFRRAHFGQTETLAELFTEVLVLAARAGLGRLGQVALDGTKIAADASKEANRTEGALRRMVEELLASAERADAAEDALFGAGVGGDEWAQEWADPVRRRDRLARAYHELAGERRAAEAAKRERAQEYLDRGGVGAPPVAAAVEAARRAVAEAIAAQQVKIEAFAARTAAADAAGGLRPAGRRPAPVDQATAVRRAYERLAKAEARVAEAAAQQGEAPEPTRNTTDVDSRLMPVRGGGFIQGYNAQAVFAADGLAVATGLTQDTTDVGSFVPMMHAAAATAERLATIHAQSGASQPPAEDPTSQAGQPPRDPRGQHPRR